MKIIQALRRKKLRNPDAPVTPEQVRSYRENGFVKVEGLLSSAEADRFKRVVDELAGSGQSSLRDDALFRQVVNNWQSNAVLKELTFHSRMQSAALALAGVPLRLWHDQLLVKRPGGSVPTEFHQDQPYWPHRSGKHSITAWIALSDVSFEKGCLCFIPGSHAWKGLPMQDLTDRRSLFRISPELEWKERVVTPLRTGDCTFHHGLTCHMAFANQTAEDRVGYAVIFMEDGTRYSGQPHVITDPLGFQEGDPIRGDLFPLIEA